MVKVSVFSISTPPPLPFFYFDGWRKDIVYNLNRKKCIQKSRCYQFLSLCKHEQIISYPFVLVFF